MSTSTRRGLLDSGTCTEALFDALRARDDAVRANELLPISGWQDGTVRNCLSLLAACGLIFSTGRYHARRFRLLPIAYHPRANPSPTGATP